MTSRSVEPVQTIAVARDGAWQRWLAFLDAERVSLPLWLPVAFAVGVAAWFLLPFAAQRLALALVAMGVGSAALLLRRAGAAGLALLLAAGLGVAEARSRAVDHVVLGRPVVATFAAEVRGVERRAARDDHRLLLALAEPGLPALVRVRVSGQPAPGIGEGARVRLRAGLAPPAGAVVPGGYDPARVAWFAGFGASGFAMGPVEVLRPAVPAGLAALRARLAALVRSRIPGEDGALAAALVTGDQSAIPPVTAAAMRDAGLVHLLSISGLHIAVVVGGTVWLVRRLLALSPGAALHLPLRGIATVAGAAAGIAYTVLAGAEVPTVRSIIAALIVLIGLAMGREAFSLRLLGVAAVLILAVRPEALLGASFQLSFAAVVAIVALYDSPLGRRLARPAEDEGMIRRLLRHAAALLATGVVAELALSSIGLFHFGRAGLYGVAANLFAIPWTSLVVMPLLIAALCGELLGITMLWPLVGWSIAAIIDLANGIAGLPGAVMAVPTLPLPAFAALIAGGLWLALWRSRARWWGMLPIAAGSVLAMTARPPDLLVTGDGRQLGVRLAGGDLAVLRRTDSLAADSWAEALGSHTEPVRIDRMPGALCSPDACSVRIVRNGRAWQVLATRSKELIPRPRFEPACAAADIVVSDRWLPGWCRPRWLKLDRRSLTATGAVTLSLTQGGLRTVADRAGDHPWAPRPAPRLSTRFSRGQ